MSANLFPDQYNYFDCFDSDVPYIEFTQPGGIFYVCTIRADKIVGIIDIKRRSEDKEFGIQRDDDKNRVKEIINYASSGDAIFPTPIIISANSKYFTFENNKIFINKELLVADKEKTIGHVLDGQHRLLGLRGCTKDVQIKFLLPIVFAFDIDPYAEALIFSTINGNQKQVSKSLMYDLFSLKSGRSIEKTCHEIVKSLNTDTESPFYGKIKILGRKASEKETLSQAAFVDHIKFLISTPSSPLHDFYKKNEDWAIQKILTNFFETLNETVNESSNQNLIDYFYKTTGFGGVSKALPEIFSIGILKNKLSKNWLKPIISDFVFNFKFPSGVGNSAMLDVKNQLINSLNSVENPKLL